MLEKEYLEEHAPILALIAAHLVNNPEWSLKLLDTTARKLLLPMYRQQRDGAAELSRAIEAGQEVVMRCPDDVVDIMVLSQLLARAERLDESLIWVDRAIKLNSGGTGCHRLRASLLERMGRIVDAEESIKLAIALSPDSADLQDDQRRITACVVVWLRQERDSATELSRAIEAGQEVLKRYPNDAPDMVAFSHLLARAECLEEALKWVERALELKADIMDYHRLRAIVLERLGRFNEAYQAATSASLMEPTNLDLLKDVRRIFKKNMIQRAGLWRLLRNAF